MAEVFEWVPNFGGEAARRPRVRKAGFGDGYAQRVRDGINNAPVSRRLVFQYDSAEIERIEAFLLRHGGARWFWFQYPGKGRIKVVCEDWSWVPHGHNDETISCAFEQVFDPGE
ncbi:phage tail protein [Chromobacterium haemolyticum]|uniref:phage tail protein n=1 Tax=Chromobacterium haemolyticum TaxID=394935 RepID=UPI0009D9231C|nr:phage tail protein [Chromobacterium haemolyticum]OQS41816.1 hypothetical protein B0T39_07715 [Chromobacterium haemolyticum]